MDRIAVKTASDLGEDERATWRDFLKSDPMGMSPYYALGFLDAMATVRADTRVIVVYRQDDIIAFIPYQQCQFGYARPLGGPLGDHHGLIQAPGVTLDLEEIFSQAGVSVYEFFGGLAWQSSLSPHVTLRDGSWVIDLSKGFEAFVEERKALQSKAMRNIRNRRRKLDAEGELTFRINDKREDILDTAMAWKGEQYERSGHFNVFSVNWTGHLLKELMFGAYEGVEGIMSSLEIEGRLVAVHIGMKSQDILHYWFPVYDAAFHKVSPGLNLLMEICKDQSERGVKAVHLGPGEYEFKAHLSSYQLPLVSGFVAPPSWMGLLRRMGHGLEQGAERLDMGLASRLPGKVLRRIDRTYAFKAR